MATTSPKPLRLELERTGSAAVLRVIGSVTLAEAYRLQEKLEEIASGRVGLIVLDLGEMDFISSMGLGAILAGHLGVRRYGGEVRLAGARPPVAQLLESTRLTKIFPLFPSVRDALTSPAPP
jgi:anti-anti-sigma factor